MIKSTLHSSFTVSNMEDAVHFFCDLLGLKADPVIKVENEGVQRIVGMAGASLLICMVHIPDGTKIELIEYVRPKGETVDLKTNNAGVAHIAFLVDDVDRMHEELSKKGVRFVSEPVWEPARDGKGTRGVCYLRGPDAITLEFMELRP